MKRMIGLAIGGFFVVMVGMSWIGQAEDKQPSGIRLIPDGPLGDTIRLGRDMVEKTTSHPLTKPYTGNALNCTSCHLKNGTDPRAASFAGVAAVYPAWSPRQGCSVETLDESGRIGLSWSLNVLEIAKERLE